MDYRKYSKYLSRDLFQLLTDIEKGTGIEVPELPPKGLMPAGARFIIKDGIETKEYIKLNDGEYHLLSGGSSGSGKQIELQKSVSHIQWRYVGDTTWTDLVALSEITGTNGTNGANGIDGDNAYVYIAYASDANGTGFTLTFNPSLDYIAIKLTTTEIPTPVAADFAGLWKNYKGAAGTNGQGVPTGGTTGQVLAKASNADYNTHWITQAAAEILFSLLPANSWGFQLMDFTTNDIVLV